MKRHRWVGSTSKGYTCVHCGRTMTHYAPGPKWGPCKTGSPLSVAAIMRIRKFYQDSGPVHRDVVTVCNLAIAYLNLRQSDVT